MARLHQSAVVAVIWLEDNYFYLDFCLITIICLLGATKSLIQISDILVNMLKKEKKKTQDALHLSSKEMSETRTAQNSPFIPKSPAGQSTAVSSALYQAQDLSTCRRRSSLLHKKTGGLTIFPAFFITRYEFLHHILPSELQRWSFW